MFVHNALVDYTVRLVLATRTPAEHGMPDVAQLIQYGASPRASLGIVRATRALALLRGRDYALPQDVQDIAPDILRHRLVLSYDALADDVPADHIVGPGDVHRPAALGRAPAERHPGAAHPRTTGRCLARPVAVTPAAAGRQLGPTVGRAASARAEAVLSRLQLLVTRKLDGLLQGDYVGPAARAGQRGGGVPGVPPRRRRAPDGLAGHRPHHRAARAADRRRPGAGDLAGGRPVGQPRLRHRAVAQARPGRSPRRRRWRT